MKDSWKDYCGTPVEIGDEVVYSGKYGFQEGTVDEIFGNCIVIKDSQTGKRTDFGWSTRGAFIKKSNIKTHE